MFIKLFEYTGNKVISSFFNTLEFFDFLLKSILSIFSFQSYSKDSRKYFIEQIYLSGLKNLPAFLFLSLILGSILIVIAIIFAMKFNLLEQIGTLLVIFVINEFSPIFTTLFFILVYSLGATENLKLLNSKNENIFYHIYTPKILATIIIIPLMSLLFATLMLTSGCLVSLFLLNIDLNTYKQIITDSIEIKNIIILLVKSFFSGYITMLIPIYFAQKFKNENDLSKSIISVLIIMLVALISIELATVLFIY